MNEKYYIALISHLAEQIYHQPIYYDRDTGQLLRYDKEHDTYYPIMTTDPAPTPIWHFDPSRLISTVDLIRSENFGNFRINFGIESEQNRTDTRYYFGTESEQNRKNGQTASEKNQTYTGTKSEQRRQELFRYYSLAEFHNLYSDPIRSIALQIEKLTYELLKNTTKRQTIDKIIEIYKKAQKQAEQGDEYHLRQTLEKLEGKRQQQINMKQLNEKRERRQKLIRTVKIVLVTTILVLGFGYKLFTGIKKNIHSTTPVKTEKTMQNQQTITVTNEKGYYIIVASFRNRQIAYEMAKNYAGAQIIERNGFYRIAVANYPTLAQARKAYYRLKSEIPDVWILKLK